MAVIDLFKSFIIWVLMNPLEEFVYFLLTCFSLEWFLSPILLIGKLIVYIFTSDGTMFIR